MIAVVPLRGSPGTYDPRTLALIRRTVAAGCSDDEFDLFVHTARHLGLDPLRRQIYAFIDHKRQPRAAPHGDHHRHRRLSHDRRPDGQLSSR